MKNKIIAFIMLAVIAGTAYSESMLSISLDVYKNDSVQDMGIRIKNNVATGTIFPGDYLLRITDEKNSSLWEKNMSLVFAVLSDPPVSTDHAFFEVIVPYSEDMRHVALYRRDKLLFLSNISICDRDGICSILRENYLSCPGDCPLDKPEGICIGDNDHVCDPDCLKGIDPDCNTSMTDTGYVSYLPGSEAINQTDDNPAGEEVKEKSAGRKNAPEYMYYLPYVAAVFAVIAALLYLSWRKSIKEKGV